MDPDVNGPLGKSLKGGYQKLFCGIGLLKMVYFDQKNLVFNSK